MKIRHEAEASTWFTAFWLDKAMILMTPFIVLMVFNNVDNDISKLIYVFMIVTSLSAVFCKKQEGLWELRHWYEKSGYVSSVFTGTCFAFGVLYGLVAR